MELPSDELVIVWVLLGSDKAASPVSMQAESLQISHSKGREELEPVVRVSEFGDLGLGDVDLLQDLVLSELRLHVVLWRLLEELLRWLVAAGFATVDLALETNRSRRDRHTSAVEAEWEKCALTKLSLVARHELRLRHRVSVT